MPDNNICSPLVPNFIQFGQLWKVGTEVPLCQCVKYGFTALMSTKLKNHFLRFVDMFCIIILRKTSTPAHASVRKIWFHCANVHETQESLSKICGYVLHYYFTQNIHPGACVSVYTTCVYKTKKIQGFMAVLPTTQRV